MMLGAWVIGVVAVLGVGGGSFLRSLWQIKRTLLPVNDAWLDHLARLAREMGLRRAPRVWMALSIRGPAVTGFLRPTLLLPAHFDDTLTPPEARLVLKHELTHIKRGDLPLNALLCILLALHWFNPLLWVAFFRVRIDREAACDAQVLDNENQAQRVAYGHTLLKVEQTFGHRGLSLGFVGIIQHGSALRSRIQSIANQPKLNPFMKITLCLGIILLTFLGITQAATLDADAPQVMIEAKFIEVGEDAKELLQPFAGTEGSPGVGVKITDDQLSALWKKIEATPGVDVLSAPRVATRSGQEAKIEIGREFAYTDTKGKSATKQLGTMLTLLPKVTEGNEIELEVSPQIVELERMAKPGSGAEQPVFRERKMTARLNVTSGQTVVLGLPSSSTEQIVEERQAGRVTTKTENVTKHTMLFVTARLVDPATDKPVDAKPAAEKSALQAKLNSIILPSVIFADATLTEAVEFLRRRSLDLDSTTTDPNQKGVNIIVKADTKATEAKLTLNLKNVPLGEALRYVAQLSNKRLVVEPHGVLLISEADFEIQQKRAAEPMAAQPTKEASHAEIHANKIILPQVTFHEATLNDAITFIRIKSLQLDPKKKGLNILIEPGGDPKAKITLQLKDVPAFEALRYCAELAGHKIITNGRDFIVTPLK